MRILSRLPILLVVMLLAGCIREQTEEPKYAEYGNLSTSPSNASTPAADSSGQKLIVTPASGLNGKVTSVNGNLRYVVLTFPIGQMPEVNRRMSLYRQGMKVGEVSVVGPQSRESIVADLTVGEAAVGDEVR